MVKLETKYEMLAETVDGTVSKDEVMPWLDFYPMVKSVRVEDVGPFKKFKANFTKGLNIICGPGGSGTTILLGCVKGMLGQEEYPRHNFEKLVPFNNELGFVEVEVFPKMRYELKHATKALQIKTSKNRSRAENTLLIYKLLLDLAKPHQAVLLDDPFASLDNTNRDKLLKMMAESNKQVIVATICFDVAKTAEDKYKANIIWPTKAANMLWQIKAMEEKK